MNKLSKMEFASQDKAVDLDALCQEIRERACTGEFDNQAYVSQDIIEKLKQVLNMVETPALYYFRDNVGNEVDLLEEHGHQIRTYEIKLSQTLNASIFKGLKYYRKLNPNNDKSFLIYGGKETTIRYGHECIPFTAIK